jgi:molecular chaperone GrpE (heat shock protein)
MRNLLYRLSKMEQTLEDERSQAQADMREFLLQVVSLSDDVTRIVERWGVTTNAREAAIIQSVVDLGRKLLAILGHYGVESIDTLGKPLDPQTSDVVGAEAREKVGPQVVLREARIGYVWRHGLLRKAQVVVSKEIPASQPEVANADDEATPDTEDGA